MRSTHWLLPAIAALALSSFMLPGTAEADELKMTPAPAASGDRPSRGMSMDKVEATFGSPSKRIPAVGEPPISRWEYPGFTVYFEHALVIHSVASS